jgi:hypothetical protein
MKLSTLFIAFFVFILKSIAQDTFFKIYNTSYFDQSFDAIETSNGDYLIIGERALSYLEDSTYGYILKINVEGSVLQEAIIGDQGEWSRFSFIQAFPGVPEKYIIGGWSDSTRPFSSIGYNFFVSSRICLSSMEIADNL